MPSQLLGGFDDSFYGKKAIPQRSVTAVSSGGVAIAVLVHVRFCRRHEDGTHAAAADHNHFATQGK
jgi:hypothetical protein